ncbi:hypothetical protein GH733_019445, partial [Mirounga leonina]
MNPLTKVKLINELNEREVQLGVADKVSWHSEYKDSAWIFLDQRSTILAVDNFNGIKIKGRTIRVDHVSNYRAPKDSEEIDDVSKELQERGCGAHTPSVSSSEGSEDDKPTKKHKKEWGQKSEPREVRKHQPSSPEVRATCRGGAGDREREPKKEKPKHEHRSSTREEKNRDRDRGRSSDTHSSRPNGRSEGRSQRSRSRSRERSHRPKRARHSWDQESSNP